MKWFYMEATSLSDWHLLHVPAHNYWQQRVFGDFGVKSIIEVLNKEPSIDHFLHYKVTIPEYFSNNPTLTWLEQHYEELNETEKEETIQVVKEAASIKAAHAMCHPRNRVGKFDWSDVMQLHLSLRTHYTEFLQTYFATRQDKNRDLFCKETAFS